MSTLYNHLLTKPKEDLAKQLMDLAKDNAALKRRVLELEVQIFWMHAKERDDTARLDYVEQHPEAQLRCHKRRWTFVGFTNYPITACATAREAIDDAMQGYPD